MSEAKGSDPAEVEEVGLGIDGEADALEKAFVAEEVHASPIRADEHRGVYFEVLSFLSDQFDESAIERSTKSSKARAQYDSCIGRNESAPDSGRHTGLENTPGCCRVQHGKERLGYRVNGNTEQDSSIRAGNGLICIGITRSPRGEGGLISPE